jgi:hypothetical protein
MVTRIGNSGNNVLIGTTLGSPFVTDDRDKLSGLEGDDVLVGGGGADLLDGGEDFDFASYEDAGSGVIASLRDPSINTGHAQGDQYVSIEGLIGSRLNDRLFGDDNDNIIDGWGGDDIVDAGGGNDVVREGAATTSLRAVPCRHVRRLGSVRSVRRPGRHSRIHRAFQHQVRDQGRPDPRHRRRTGLQHP